MKLRGVVKDAVSQYDDLRKKIEWEDAGFSETIHRLAQPFLNGYFTVAVAGKMSAGKSTFINSLIGENLLPTGHFQTTSGITWIVSSDKRRMEVTFADGHKEAFTEGFADKLTDLVKVPEKYDMLPINDINCLISCGDGIEEILKKKAGIEEKTGTHSDEKLWRDYVAKNPKFRIAKEVVIELQLPKEYEGWRIVDTPGIGAIGGIQDATKELLTKRTQNDINRKEVDAVILLHNGAENIQDQSANEFAMDVAKSLGKLANGRLFFVLTHAANTEFLDNKDGVLKRAGNLFGEKLGIPEKNIFYVDSILQRFLFDAENSGRDFSRRVCLKNQLEGWTENDWKALKRLLGTVYDELDEGEIETSNSIFFDKVREIANYEKLQRRLYEFLKDEKQQAFKELMGTIAYECKVYGERLNNDIKATCSGREEIERQKKNVDEEKIQLNTALGELGRETSPATIKEKFKFIDDELGKLSQKKSISEVRTEYLKIIDDVLEKERKFFQGLIDRFKDHFKDHSNVFGNENSISKTLDLGALEREAEKNATSKIPDKSKPVEVLVKEHTFSRDETKVTYPYTKDVVDFDKKRREFTALVVKEGREWSRSFINETDEKAKEFFRVVDKNIQEKTEATKKRLDKLNGTEDERKDKQKRLENKRTEVQKLVDFLKKMEV